MFRIAKGVLKLFSVRITKKSSAALGRRTRKSHSTCNNKSHIHKKDDLDGRLFCYGHVPVVAKRPLLTLQLSEIVPSPPFFHALVVRNRTQLSEIVPQFFTKTGRCRCVSCPKSYPNTNNINKKNKKEKSISVFFSLWLLFSPEIDFEFNYAIKIAN